MASRLIGRLGRMEKAVATRPVSETVVDQALELFHEAVYGDDHERHAPRRIQAWHADCGVDVTAHNYLAEVELPDHGTCGMHVLAFPERLANPSHVRQARRLPARYADLRERIDHSDPRWREPIMEAVMAFSERGELPEDGLLREVVLADADLQALWDLQLSERSGHAHTAPKSRAR